MEIKKGDVFQCVQDLIVNNIVLCKKGYMYRSNEDGYISANDVHRIGGEIDDYLEFLFHEDDITDAQNFANSSCSSDDKDMTKEIPKELYDKLCYLGIIDEEGVRGSNVGESNYSEHLIQAWTIWLDYPELTPFDCDIIKRVLRKKKSDTRKMDYEKIIHICEERIRQLNCEVE